MTENEQTLPAPVALSFEQACQVAGGIISASLIKYAGPMPPALFTSALAIRVSAVNVAAFAV